MASRKVNRTRQVQPSGMSYDTKILLVVILLVFAYPLGIALMWAWMKDWPMWLKIFITLPFILGVIFFFGFLALLGKLVKEAVHQNDWQYSVQQASPSANQMPDTSPTISPGKAY